MNRCFQLQKQRVFFQALPPKTGQTFQQNRSLATDERCPSRSRPSPGKSSEIRSRRRFRIPDMIQPRKENSMLFSRNIGFMSSSQLTNSNLFQRGSTPTTNQNGITHKMRNWLGLAKASWFNLWFDLQPILSHDGWGLRQRSTGSRNRTKWVCLNCHLW